MALHQSAQNGFSDAASYDTHRPSYPSVAVDKFLGHLGLAKLTGASVIDLAAGTGKLTQSLTARPEDFSILAVEPHKGMRGELERKSLPRVDARDGFAEKIPAPDEWADSVVAGQAFHWFATTEALGEIARVLKPQGTLGVIWNVEEYNKPKHWPATTPWEESLNQLVHSLESDGQQRFRQFLWKDVFDAQVPSNPVETAANFLVPGSNKGPFFSVPIGEDSEPWVVWLAPEALWKRLATLSQVAMLEGEALDKFRARYDEILREPSVQTNDEGEVAVHGKTYFAWSSKV
ncbi:methyltransferase domain-containing protein [Plectosphaerella cucumerina]|uniref:Methyltransferase domain-containing protein n=1 Tax=Plectosphaerella cucumerina TaxID=40658 RepID=A0A8K0TD10_9PEZI|nr:methyltransferase domain-containing protein [Plectosphaerella cucumerina]